MFQNFLIKKILKRQGVPEAQIDIFVKMIGENPALFKKIGEEVQEKMKNGMSQIDASALVFKQHEEELKKIV